MTTYTKYLTAIAGDSDYQTSADPIIEIEKSKTDYMFRLLSSISDTSAIDHVTIKAKQSSITYGSIVYGAVETMFDGRIETISDYTYYIVPENSFLTTPMEKPEEFSAYSTKIYIVVQLCDSNNNVLWCLRFNLLIKEDSKPVVYYRKIKWTANAIPTVIHINQYDNNYKFIFDMDSDDGLISSTSSYLTESSCGVQLRGLRPDGRNLIIHGNIDFLNSVRKNGVTTFDIRATFPAKSSDPAISEQSLSDISELTEISGVVILQVVFYYYTLRNQIRYISTELLSSKINLIIEATP